MELKIESVRHGNHIILIDDEDYDKIKNITWHIGYERHSGGYYVLSKIWVKEEKKQYQIAMHRIIMDCPKGMIVDHINHNGLDNRKCNLRICTHSENGRNVKKHRIDTSSRYKGVCKKTKEKNYSAQITIDKKRIHIGTFKTEDQAAIAYNIAALKHHGEYASLNNVMAHR